MHALSIILIIVAGLAATGLLYEMAAEQRRVRYQAHSRREWERLHARPDARSQSGK